MVSARVKVVNTQGLHMRPAQLLVNALSRFESEVTLVANGKSINGKSIMYLMTACLKQGDEVEIQCDGADEKKALEEAVALFQSGFGE
ncbi:MAG: HPr family phosphocarrier protein [Pygmaiobacter massiliensis]|nr:HPr family phosphocarrier protein [Pygmaiobacter massiliensis]